MMKFFSSFLDPAVLSRAYFTMPAGGSLSWIHWSRFKLHKHNRCKNQVSTKKKIIFNFEFSQQKKNFHFSYHPRCTVESFLVSHLIRAQVAQFDQLDRTQELLPTFTQREMPIHGALARMELVGFPADTNKLAHLIDRLKAAKCRISDRVRTLNGGRQLNFGSSSEVAAALKVPRERNGRVKTCRQVLEKIDSPLASLVIAYRKIESNLMRTIEPLYRAIRDGKRIYGNSCCFTSTGRISMHEPNLQTVVKDFKVRIDQ